MNKLYLLTMAVIALLLSGCASTKPEIITANNQSSLKVFYQGALSDLNDNNDADHALRKVSPIDSGISLGMSILNTVMALQDPATSSNKNVHKGTFVKALPNPTLNYFTPKANVVIEKWLDEKGEGYRYQQPLTIGYATWSLNYKNLIPSDPLYQLNYKLIFYKKPEKGSYFSRFIIRECTPLPVEAPLADWQSNSYQKVKDETQHYMDECLNQLRLQLPDLLKKA